MALAKLAAAIESRWDRVGLANILLLPIGVLFQVIASIRRTAYSLGLLQSHRLPVPVVVVGNITAGGSGKTPVVLLLAEQLCAAGFRPGIMSRGYGGSLSAPKEVLPTSLATTCGDEPLLMARRALCPVWVGRDRVAVGKALLERHPQVNVLICDDGLQHYRLQRDIELVVLDRRGLRNGLPLPAGPLREPASRLSRVQAILANEGATAQALHRQVAGVPWFDLRMQPKQWHKVMATTADVPRAATDVAQWNDCAIDAIAGIGEPERFFEAVRSLGLEPLCTAFPDHHVFEAKDFSALRGEVLLMTEKDAVKCTSIAPAKAWYLSIEATVNPDLVRTVIRPLLENAHGSAPA